MCCSASLAKGFKRFEDGFEKLGGDKRGGPAANIDTVDHVVGIQRKRGLEGCKLARENGDV